MFLPGFVCQTSKVTVLRFCHDHIKKISEVTTIIMPHDAWRCYVSSACSSMESMDLHVIKELSHHGMIEDNGVIQTEP